ncbi:MAG: divalent metal cation transporter [Candidatus Acidiferrum sp.]
MSPVGERENLYANLGPGLITGAADDDPSGIATYSQVGAQFGFAMLWTMLFSFPSMAAIREICSRLGRITGMGVAANLADCYPSVVRGLVFLLWVANIFNLGADVAATAAFQLLVGRKLLLYAIFFGGVFQLLQVYVPYRIYGAIVSALDFLASFTN